MAGVSHGALFLIQQDDDKKGMGCVCGWWLSGGEVEGVCWGRERGAEGV